MEKGAGPDDDLEPFQYEWITVAPRAGGSGNVGGAVAGTPQSEALVSFVMSTLRSGAMPMCGSEPRTPTQSAPLSTARALEFTSSPKRV
jgi:hypothetical protein